MHRRTVRSSLAAISAMTALFVPALTGSSTAFAPGTPIPAHVYAPHFET